MFSRQKSEFINWLAKKRGKVFIPKWLNAIYKIGMCDVCCEYQYLPSDLVVEYKKFRYPYHKEPMVGWVYRHAAWQDCARNDKYQNELQLKCLEKIKNEKGKLMGMDISKKLYEKITGIIVEQEIEKTKQRIEKIKEKINNSAVG